jgi:hypothetical protein
MRGRILPLQRQLEETLLFREVNLTVKVHRNLIFRVTVYQQTAIIMMKEGLLLLDLFLMEIATSTDTWQIILLFNQINKEVAVVPQTLLIRLFLIPSLIITDALE